MIRIPAESETKRNIDNVIIYSNQNKSKKNYKSLIIKILLIIIILIVITVVIVILVKKFVLNNNKLENCPIGFFHPEDNGNKKSSCYPCTLPNCKKCQGNIKNNKCTECQIEFKQEYNEQNEIINCSLQSSEIESSKSDEINFTCGDDCLECDKNNKICTKCKMGYFLPDDGINKYSCEKCSLNNCKKCQGNKNDDICILCEDNYITKYDISNKIKYCNEKCIVGDENKCKTCDFEKNECLNCNYGFYLPSDDEIKLECKSCSINHCKSCHGTKNVDICNLCENNYEPELDNNIIKSCIYQEPSKNNCEIGDGDKCLTCSETEPNKCATCNPFYKLVNGKCELDNQGSGESNNDYISFVAKYVSREKNKKIPIINSGKKAYIKQMKVDGILKNSNLNVDNDGKFLFEKNEYTMEIWLEIRNDILKDLFYEIESLQNIIFNKVDTNNNHIKMISMENMFSDCNNLISLDISNLDTKNVENMDLIFYGCSSLKVIDLSKNSFDNLETAFGSFAFCTSLTSINLETQFPKLYDFNNVFYGTSSIKSIDLSSMRSLKLKNIANLFANCYSLEYVNLNNFNTSQVTNMLGLFYNNNKLTSVDLSLFNTKKVFDMKWMFFNCSSLTYLDLSSFDTSLVTDMKEMFYNCSSLTSLNFGKSFNTSLVTNMSYMFSNCTSLTQLDLRFFNTKNVKNMQCMFATCKKLVSVDVSSFDTSQVTKFVHIFSNCYALTSIDLSNFNFTTSEKYYTGPPMIYYCKSLKFIDITPINQIFRDFFTGIPTSGGKIRASRKLQIYLLQTGIKVLLDWDWEIVNK